MKTIGYIALFIGVAFVFGHVIKIGLDREMNRMDAVRIDNCQKYGYKINEDAGRDICPPTSQG